MGYDTKVHPWRYFKCDMDVLIGEDRDRKNSTITPILLLIPYFIRIRFPYLFGSNDMY
jgi:hypothetical protein